MCGSRAKVKGQLRKRLCYEHDSRVARAELVDGYNMMYCLLLVLFIFVSCY